MKIMVTSILSASVFAVTFGITAEEGLMKAIATIDKTPKPLVPVSVIARLPSEDHIRELHGDIKVPQIVKTKEAKRQVRLARYKALLRKQAKQRRLGLSRPKLTML